MAGRTSGQDTSRVTPTGATADPSTSNQGQNVSRMDDDSGTLRSTDPLSRHGMRQVLQRGYAMKTLIFGLIASVAIAAPALAGNASAHGRDDQGTGVSARARASYAYAPRHHRRHAIGIDSGQ